tara:strand:+ start:258 stop:809 length:552 start_codon:yes stop_codon:yes gene_type:complete
MLNTLLERMFKAQERVTGESADFVRDLRRASPGGFWRFAFFTPMASYRRALPVEAYAVAKIAASHAEDCGPCLQTTVNLAKADGVSDQIIRAAVLGDVAAMDERTGTAFAFARAVCAHDFASEELRPKLVAWWGEAGVAELSLAICSSRLFPTLKRGLGHGQACQRIVVGAETLHVAAPARAA